MKKILHFNESGFNNRLEHFNEAKKAFQHLIDLYSSHAIDGQSLSDLSPILSMEEAVRMSKKPEAYIKNRVSGKTHPDYSKLTQQAAICRVYYPLSKYLTLTGGKVNLSKESDELIKSTFQIETENPDLIEFNKLHNYLSDTLTKINQLSNNIYGLFLVDTRLSIHGDKRGLCEMNELFTVEDNGTVSVNTSFYLNRHPKESPKGIVDDIAKVLTTKMKIN